MEVLAAVDEAGADCLILCDTNGGSLPDEVRAITEAVVRDVSAPVGVHLHNDTDCGVANALAGVQGGASQVQGTINGYGERTGNCNIVSVIANLELKLGINALPEGHLDRMFSVSHHIAELVNIVPHSRQAFVGFQLLPIRRACIPAPFPGVQMPMNILNLPFWATRLVIWCLNVGTLFGGSKGGGTGD